MLSNEATREQYIKARKSEQSTDDDVSDKQQNTFTSPRKKPRLFLDFVFGSFKRAKNWLEKSKKLVASIVAFLAFLRELQKEIIKSKKRFNEETKELKSRFERYSTEKAEIEAQWSEAKWKLDIRKC